MNDFLDVALSLVAAIKMNMPFLLGILGLLWGINLLNFLVGYRLNIFGIYPRTLHGLLGIIPAPFLHGNFGHLFFNSIPLFVLASLVLLYGREVFFCVTFMTMLVGGLGVWAIGRKAFHVGASSVIMGYWGFLLVNAYYQGTFMAVILGAISFYYFGGLLLSLVPGEVRVSWESHLFGFLGGVLAVFVYPLII